jgi:hypothetical protein
MYAVCNRVLATGPEGPVEETLDATNVTTLAPLPDIMGETFYELTSLQKLFPRFVLVAYCSVVSTAD